jgi:hypothetical protein
MPAYIHTHIHTYIHTTAHMNVCLQAPKYVHTAAVAMWCDAKEQNRIPAGWSPIVLQPVDCERFPDIYYVTQHENRVSQLSYISTSQGRRAAHIFLVKTARPCFVKLYLCKGVWKITCESTSGGHWGVHAHCCKKIYNMIQAEPSGWSRSRSQTTDRQVTVCVTAFMNMHFLA